jgi:hypothetical protein
VASTYLCDEKTMWRDVGRIFTSFGCNAPICDDGSNLEMASCHFDRLDLALIGLALIDLALIDLALSRGLIANSENSHACDFRHVAARAADFPVNFFGPLE